MAEEQIMTGLAAALAAAQAELPAVEKEGVNPHFRSQFVTLDALIDATRPVLNRHGLAILQWCSGSSEEPTLTTQLVHTSGEKLASTMPLYLARRDMQGLGAAITYARRYAWAAVLGVASDQDDDGETAVERPRVNTRTGEIKEPPAAEPEPWPGLWPVGKFEGKALSETPDGYLKWYSEKGKNPLWRQACKDELALREVVF